MNTTAQIRLPRPAVETEQRTEPRRSARASERPTFGEMLAEVVPVIGVVPVAGPPAIFVLAPWLFLVLMLAGPFAFLVALVVVMLVAAAVLAALAAAVVAIVAAPFLLVRRRRGHRAPHASTGQVVALGSPRVA